MRSWHIVPVNGVGQLQQVEQEQPTPGPGEVLVRIRAASLNHRDLHIRERAGSDPAGVPIVPLSDGAGEVAALGEGCNRFHPGDRVVIPFFPYWLDGPPLEEKLLGRGEAGTPGVLSDYLVVEEKELLPLPKHLTYAEGATLPCAGVTTWNALSSGQFQPGETILLLGTGGVSIFGLQFAKVAGARAIIISRSEEKLARARTLGADQTINSTTIPHWDERVLEFTGGRGVDHVLEVGGVETLPLSLGAVRLGGRVNLIGGLGGFVGSVEFSKIRQRLAVIQTFYVGNRAVFRAMNSFISQYQIHPIIDRVFPFEQAAEAFGYLAEGRHFGKVVIEW